MPGLGLQVDVYRVNVYADEGPIPQSLQAGYCRLPKIYGRGLRARLEPQLSCWWHLPSAFFLQGRASNLALEASELESMFRDHINDLHRRTTNAYADLLDSVRP